MAYRETARMQQRKQATRDTIVVQALKLLDERGFAGIQMVVLAQRANLATGTLYRYFGSKEQLCETLFKQATQIEIQQVQEQLQHEQANASERIAAALTTFAKRALRAPTTAWALIAEPVEPIVVAARLKYRERYAQLFEQAIELGIADGSLPQQNSALASRALVGAIAEALIGPLAQQAQQNEQQSISDSVRFCLQAITARTW
ncbi:TetR/AcrR family transcriptional regulator [Idiomarina aminovorans]|uniref:TetR/AcrR family transcriptional regulator n=1 Tax=Idiomarina aminovorans TaxID=2914829 RepID=UPI002002B99D|nr:TetR/AcrR family transcriptional regulator [Idiomarina sp. ATCH4]MCK7458424.1 TetR/AcrR family transcriptional regulator [Idiomarina sp. ATCH4]